jgi:DNA-directed RNA polymerase specialized sigma24 family protein
VRLVGRKSEPRQGSELVSDFEQLYRDAGTQLWRAIYGFVGGRRQVAEDAVAEAFARAIEHADEIRSPLPWLYRTAFRLAVRELQRERRRRLSRRNRLRGSIPGRCKTS